MTAQQTTPWLTLIRFAGIDRISFLQGQLTQDLARLNADAPFAAAASCDPKGRVLAVLTLIHEPDAIVVGLRTELSEAWLTGILRYKMRAKVDAQIVTDLTIIPLPNDTPVHQNHIATWQIGTLRESLVATQNAGTFDGNAWREARLLNGLTDIAQHATSGFTPHMLNLDRADAISFKKGCYTGQEIVARTEHLGKAKRRVRLLTSDAGVSDTVAQDVMTDDGTKLGIVVAGAGHTLAAVIGDKDIEKPMFLEAGQALNLVG